ncbi:flavin reductase family protein [Streptomyces melanosporofaciens]|uniref:NADH-FMN oxidoreductase RutF, flavin reductase (DIM6/NTAB) family n=1 Tax=Streptomyces melanosporofaciens TaxID=67327 RepID=A0A1H5ATK0_STRMJ|nr:flavin reductase family protein [Streptomyces melanosporofaciens]SED44950.1 NADH-FMN oxidoreductase RutF, flavin reductase (DIM6/NTAB) family [Streptomyces melanosporofaciens]
MTETLDITVGFRATMSRLATGVSVITTRSGDTPIGMTASAVSALSLDPLQLLVCIANHLYTRTAIAEHGRFAVNVLGEDSEALARNFAASKPDKFAGVETFDDHGVPVLQDAIAVIVCDVAEALPGGDHTIFVGDVRYCDHRTECRPLLHFAGGFGTLGAPH